MKKEIFREQYKLRSEELIALIQGKSLNFFLPNQYHVEILPPNHGVTVQYEDWAKIATFLRCAAYPDSKIVDDLIEKIEGRK